MAIANVYFAPNANTGNAYGAISIATTNQIQITSGERVQNYFGNNFTFSEDSVTGGTVTLTNYYENDRKIYEISGGNYSAVTVASLVLSGDSAGLMSYIYAGSDRYNGCSENDFVNTGTGDDQIYGNGGNDSLSGGAGNDTIDGGANMDFAIFSSSRSSVTVTKSASGWNTSSFADGADTLTNIERLQFSDKYLALDLSSNGSAGQAMEFIGVIAPALLDSAPIRGMIISLFDQGQTMEGLCQLALDLNLVPKASSAELANAVFSNVTGGAMASQDMTNALVGYIESHSQANFLATVAGMHINVDLVGLQQTGIEYSL